MAVIGFVVKATGLNQNRFVLNGASDRVEIGNNQNCMLWFSSDIQDENLLGEFVCENEQWIFRALSGMVIRCGSKANLKSIEIKKDMAFELRSQKNDQSLCVLHFSLWRAPTRDFSLRVQMKDNALLIGSSRQCQIILPEKDISQISVRIQRQRQDWVIQADESVDFTINGCKASGAIKLHNRCFLGIGPYNFYYCAGFLYTSAVDDISVKDDLLDIQSQQTSAFHYPTFMRSTRVRPEIADGKIEILPPKRKEEHRSQNLLLQIVPQIGSLALIVVLRGILGGGGMFVAYSASTMILGMGVSLFARRDEKKRRFEAEKDREQKYQNYILAKTEEIIKWRQDESVWRHRIYRPFEENLATVRNFDKGIFDRAPSDSDFLSVRMGEGDALAAIQIEAPKREYKETEDPLIEIPQQLAEKYRFIEGAPVVSEFRDIGALGVVGDPERQYELLKGMVLDLCIRQYYKEVRFYFIVAEKEVEKYAWTRWLRNCYDENSMIRNLIYNDESAKYHLEQLYKVLAYREENLEMHGSADHVPQIPHYVVFVAACERVRNHPLSQFFEKSGKLGCTFVFMNEHEELIPRGCGELVRLDKKENMGDLIKCGNEAITRRFRYPMIPDEIIHEVTAKLCPVEVVEANLETSLTKKITMFELLGIRSVNEIHLGKLWSESNIENSMRVPLGVRSKNDIVYLDLDEKAHGPHGLVAGTTGSGKSEILQSYIISLAMHFSPEEVGFLLIDFKGGGMANQFERLPHLLGTITNIDGREIQRSLKSMHAEMVRRQELFKSASTDELQINSIKKYIHLHKTNPAKASVPLPHLVIIVDEFAELKNEHGEFMDELISMARIGRSLGVHLILATQKPVGVVDDQIWSNSNLRLCLRVQTREDSKEVIKTPLAAEIREPGRAYMQVGNNEIFELFQSAFSGAPIPDVEASGNRFSLSEVNYWGQKKTVFDNRVTPANQEMRTELSSVVDHIVDYCESSSVVIPRRVCLPSLCDPTKDAALLLKDVLLDVKKDGRIRFTLGMLDDPERHEQKPLHVDVMDSNVFLLGASQTGKTVLLITAVMSLAYAYSPRDVNVYIIDGGNSIPKSLEESGIVGGICYREEEEKINNLFGMLHREIAARRKRFGEVNVGSYAAYKEAGFTDMPVLLVMMDNAVSFKEYCESQFGTYLGLTREGNTVGIFFVMSSTQYSVMNSRFMIGFGTRMSLNCNEKEEYSSLFSRCRIEPLDVPGRGLIMIDKRILEYQTAWYAEGKTEQERNNNLQMIIGNLNLGYGGASAKRIPMIPDIVNRNVFFADNKSIEKYRVPVGIDYLSIEPVYLNLLDHWLLPVIGRSRSGRTNFIRIILDYIQHTTLMNRTECYICDSSQKALKYCDRDYGFVERYSIDPSDGIEYIHTVAEILEEREAEITQSVEDVSEAELLSRYPLLMLVLAGHDFVQYVSKDAEAMESIEKIKRLSRYRAIILMDNVDIVYASSSMAMVNKIKSEKKCILIEDLANIPALSSVVQIQTKDMNANTKPVRVGDAYIYNRGKIEKKIRTVFCE